MQRQIFVVPLGHGRVVVGGAADDEGEQEQLAHGRWNEDRDQVIGILKSSIDEKLVDAEYKISEQKISRSVSWNGGVLNIELHERPDSSAQVLLNFHRSSSDSAELKAWVERCAEMVKTAKTLLQETLGLTIKDDTDE
jgi:hypothetical protein